MADGGESELESSTASTSNNTGNVPLKVILVGLSGVGKSTLFLRIRDGKFYADTERQMLDFLDKTITIKNNQTVQMRLYDTANMEWHKNTVTRSYYLDSRVALIVYSADNMHSVDNLVLYIKEVNRNSPSAKKFLVRNKIDLEDETETVTEEEVDAKLQRAGHVFQPKWKHKVSAKSGEGIEDLIKEIGIALRHAGSTIPRNEHLISTLYQNNQPTKQNSSPCC